MKQFWTLVRYEIKKLLNRKVTWVAVLGISLVMLLFGCSDLFLMSEDITGETVNRYEMIQKNLEAEKTLVGQPMDENFYANMMKALENSQENPEAFRPYSELYNEAFKSILKNYGSADSMAEFHERRKENIAKIMERSILSEEEVAYWKTAKEQEELPWIFDSCYGLSRVWVACYTMVVLCIPMIGVCLAPMFSEEHQKRTDQLILCTKAGRRVIFWAKMTAGILFALGSTLLVILCTVVPMVVFGGSDGWDAPIQLYLPTSPYQMTFGEVILMNYLMCLLAMVMYAAMAMCLSELFPNSPIPVMAIFVAMLLVGMMVMIPQEWKTVSMWYELQPFHTLTVWAMFDYRLFSVFGLLLTKFQVASLVYGVLVVLFVWGAKKLYLRYQVSGR